MTLESTSTGVEVPMSNGEDDGVGMPQHDVTPQPSSAGCRIISLSTVRRDRASRSIVNGASMSSFMIIEDEPVYRIEPCRVIVFAGKDSPRMIDSVSPP